MPRSVVKSVDTLNARKPSDLPRLRSLVKRPETTVKITGCDFHDAVMPENPVTLKAVLWTGLVDARRALNDSNFIY